MTDFPAVKVAQAISSPNLPPDAARLRFKNMVGHGYIFTRERTRDRSATDGRGTLLFSKGDILTAAILSELMDLGGLSREAMQAAALRLQGWGVGEVPTPGPEWMAAAQTAANAGEELPDAPPEVRKAPESPALWMYQTFTEGKFAPPGFTLRLSWQKPVAGGNGFCTAAISHGDFGELGEGLLTAPGHVPVADLILPIDPILLAVHARIEALVA